MYQRIKQYLDGNQISLNGLAKTLNMNQSTVLRQVKGEQTLSSTLVENFLNAYPDVSAEWLMRGKGTSVLCKTAESIAEKTKLNYAAETPHYNDAASVLGEFHNLLGLHSFNDSSGLLVGGYGCSLTPAIFRQEIKLRVLVLSLAVDGVGKI